MQSLPIADNKDEHAGKKTDFQLSPSYIAQYGESMLAGEEVSWIVFAMNHGDQEESHLNRQQDLVSHFLLELHKESNWFYTVKIASTPSLVSYLSSSTGLQLQQKQNSQILIGIAYSIEARQWKLFSKSRSHSIIRKCRNPSLCYAYLKTQNGQIHEQGEQPYHLLHKKKDRLQIQYEELCYGHKDLMLPMQNTSEPDWCFHALQNQTVQLVTINNFLSELSEFLSHTDTNSISEIQSFAKQLKKRPLMQRVMKNISFFQSLTHQLESRNRNLLTGNLPLQKPKDSEEQKQNGEISNYITDEKSVKYQDTIAEEKNIQ